MSTKVQAVPLNYPSQSGKGAESPVFITKRVHGGHLANDSRSTQHIPVNGAEWGESAPTNPESFQALGNPRAVGAVESHIDGLVVQAGEVGGGSLQLGGASTEARGDLVEGTLAGRLAARHPSVERGIAHPGVARDLSIRQAGFPDDRLNFGQACILRAANWFASHSKLNVLTLVIKWVSLKCVKNLHLHGERST